MNTTDARTRLRDMAADALRITERMEMSRTVSWEERAHLRELAAEARSVLGDAGYPGEAAWRGIQRVSLGLDTQGAESDPGFWNDLAQDLRSAQETLNSLVNPRGRDSDIRIVG